MATSNITISDLREIEKLIIKRDKLQAEIDEINKTLPEINLSKREKRKSIGAKIAAVASGKRGRRGQLKEAILEALQSAGPGGIHVRTIAERIGKPVQSVQQWFQMTGKKLPQVKKVERATYALTGASVPSAKSASPSKPKAKKKVRKKG